MAPFVHSPCSCLLPCCVIAQGRIFIDRDPQHFGLILNFLRDGICVLPTDVDARRQILQEADFYQLESLRAFIMHEDRRDLQTAQDLRACIATRLEVILLCCPSVWWQTCSTCISCMRAHCRGKWWPVSAIAQHLCRLIQAPSPEARFRDALHVSRLAQNFPIHVAQKPYRAALSSAQMDEGVKEIVRMLLRCAYGSPLDMSSKIPSHSACVEVAVRETAFNPLSSPSVMAQPDERIYVAFQQHITFQVGPCGTRGWGCLI